MICIYHNRDLDGFTSGAIVKKWHDKLNDYPDNVKKGELKLIGYDYGLPIPYDKIPEGESIIMIDVSLKMSEMSKLARHSKNLIWIDHHISAIKEYEAFMTEQEEHYHPYFKAVLQNGIAACEIAWNYLFPNQVMPKAIKLLGEYDTWRNNDKERWENEILPFQFGMRLYCNSPETFPKALIYNDVERESWETVDYIVKQGKTVLQYQTMLNEIQCKNAAFEYDFNGYKAICLNGGGFNSDVFKSVYDETKHDIMMPFQFNGKQWTISLYTTKDNIDCSAIAKSKGGGGHKKAAGFQVTNIESIFNFVLLIWKR